MRTQARLQSSIKTRVKSCVRKSVRRAGKQDENRLLKRGRFSLYLLLVSRHTKSFVPWMLDWSPQPAMDAT